MQDDPKVLCRTSLHDQLRHRSVQPTRGMVQKGRDVCGHEIREWGILRGPLKQEALRAPQRSNPIAKALLEFAWALRRVSQLASHFLDQIEEILDAMPQLDETELEPLLALAQAGLRPNALNRCRMERQTHLIDFFD